MESIVREIMKTERGTDRYVELAIQENEIIKRKNDIKPYLEMMEEEEKLAFDFTIPRSVKATRKKDYGQKISSCTICVGPLLQWV